ncbi:hypothetical protein INR49_006286 [Caranx melampygus]|nr:hypothetical protein INR49_006286 [Caranx melampygus]
MVDSVESSVIIVDLQQTIHRRRVVTDNDDPVEPHYRAVEPALEVQAEHILLPWFSDRQLLCNFHHHILLRFVFKATLHRYLPLPPLVIQHLQPGLGADKCLPYVEPQMVGGLADLYVYINSAHVGVVDQVWLQEKIIVDWLHIARQAEIPPVPTGVIGRRARPSAWQRWPRRLHCRGLRGRSGACSTADCRGRERRIAPLETLWARE